jgi:parallel beta-helix repeat protein
MVSSSSIIRVPDDFEKIQWAVGNASDGDTIFVRAGTYYEHVTVSKPLVLVGEDKATTIIDGNGTGTVVSVTADSVVINGFTLRNSGKNGYWSFDAGIYLHSGSNEITGNVLMNSNYGIIMASYTMASGGNMIIDNNVQNNNYGIYGSGKKNVISNNTVTGNPRHGIWLQGLGANDSNIITGNIVSNSDYGISLCGWIIIGGTTSSELRHSVLQGSSESQSPPPSNNTVSDNMVTDCGYGISIELCNGNTVTGNIIARNNVGLSMIPFIEEGSLNNTIYHNNFVDNTAQVYTSLGYANTWDDGFPSGGNYWGDYEDRYPNATQIDDSGIWDTPYVIDEDNQDNYPLLHRYGCIRNLDTNLAYLTVQSAIDAPETLEGHTIFVEEGLYSEHVFVNKTISLVGEDRETTIIDGGGMITPIVHITANNVTVRAFTIQNSGRIYGWEGGGIYITDSNRNSIIGNTIINTQYGINLRNSTKNTIVGNTMIENDVGIQFLDEYSSDSTIYHNNFIDNGWQVNSFAPSNNSWDNGYPSGGNYWSDYEERYPNATEIDNSGIWNTPYVIDENSQDNYPLVPEFPTWTPMLLILIVLTVPIAIYKRRLNKAPIH